MATMAPELERDASGAIAGDDAELLARAAAGDDAAFATIYGAAVGEAVRIVERSLGELPLKQRAVACLFLEAELAPAEIAPLMGMTANAARVTLHRALARLRADLAAAGIDAPPTADEPVEIQGGV
jgi:DNA-directed RNA polymerase specialized sigma24 family protein